MLLNLFEYIIVNSFVRKYVQSHFTLKKFLTAPNLIKNKKVLEVGCGNGYGTKLISKYLQPSQIVGIDLDRRMIKIAKKNKSSNVVFKVEDVTKLSFKNSSFDGVVIFATVHHIPNWKKALDEIYRVLKTGGQIFVEESSSDSFKTFYGTIVKKICKHPYEQMFSRSEFLTYMKKLGFKFQKKYIFTPLIFLPLRFVLIAVKTGKR